MLFTSSLHNLYILSLEYWFCGDLRKYRLLHPTLSQTYFRCSFSPTIIRPGSLTSPRPRSPPSCFRRISTDSLVAPRLPLPSVGHMRSELVVPTCLLPAPDALGTVQCSSWARAEAHSVIELRVACSVRAGVVVCRPCKLLRRRTQLAFEVNTSVSDRNDKSPLGIAPIPWPPVLPGSLCEVDILCRRLRMAPLCTHRQTREPRSSWLRPDTTPSVRGNDADDGPWDPSARPATTEPKQKQW
jgi:hypothetical protein